jgi:hypothetical protein
MATGTQIGRADPKEAARALHALLRVVFILMKEDRDLRKFRLVLTGLCLASSLLPLCLHPAKAQAPADVPREHWAYPAVEDLASKGLIKGYPPDGKFFGKRTVTRYEMATIIQRVLARVDELLGKKQDKGEQPPAGVTKAELDEVRRLVNEYKMELTVMGTDLQKVKDQIGELNDKVNAAQQTADAASAAAIKASADAVALRKELGDFRGELKDVREALRAKSGEIDALSKDYKAHKISGYIQGRFEAFDTGRTNLFTPTGSGGTGQLPTNGGPSVGGPWNGFLVRRARLKVSGPISANTDYGLQIDAPSTSAVNVKEAYALISRFPAKGLSLKAGQFGVPFGYELDVSSSVRESPERAVGFAESTAASQIFKTSVSATGGVVTPGSAVPLFLNQEYDSGVTLTWNSPSKHHPAKVILGLFNGEGSGASGVRNLNNGLDLVGRAETALFDERLELGISGYYGSLPVRGGPPAGAPAVPVGFVNAYRALGGADVRYITPWGTIVRAEYVGGLFETTPDRAQYLENNHAQAWYVVAQHPLSKKLNFVLKYDEFMPISQGGKSAGGLGRMELIRKTLQGGFLYQFDPATRFRLWYQKGLTPYDPSAASGPLRSHLGLLTGEVQVKF